jgi:hypothetical protein
VTLDRRRVLVLAAIALAIDCGGTSQAQTPFDAADDVVAGDLGADADTPSDVAVVDATADVATKRPFPSVAPIVASDCASSGRQLYVATSGDDASAGTAAAPWKSFAHADTAAKPGDTIHVLAGDYVDAVVTRSSGTASARICWLSDVVWGARIRTTGALESWSQHADFVDVIGFDVTGDGAVGIMNVGSDDRIVGNHVHHIPATGCTTNGGAGVDSGGYTLTPPAHDVDFISNVVHDIGDPTVECFRVHGIYHGTAGGHVFDNVAYRNQSFGIHLWHGARDIVIANNLVFANGQGGILVGSGDSGSGPSTGSGMVVVNNMVIANGVWNTAPSGGESLREYGTIGANVYANNLSWGNSGGADAFALLNGNVATATVHADPSLVDFRVDGTGDYHARPGSAAIDAGTSANAPSYDLEGFPRPFGAAFDIGVYEWRE